MKGELIPNLMEEIRLLHQSGDVGRKIVEDIAFFSSMHEYPKDDLGYAIWEAASKLLNPGFWDHTVDPEFEVVFPLKDK
jgi:hypothetical protein